MAINWRRRETVFRLLAAVYAELGEEVFKGRYVSIATYFGPDATYDAIKSFFNKEVLRAAEELMAQYPDHRGSGRGVSERRGPRQGRPPEDISILTQREAEAHFSHSLRAPAKRPRVVAATSAPSHTQNGSLQVVIPDETPPGTLPNGDGNGVRVPTPHEDSADPSSCPCPSSNPGPSSYFTADGQVNPAAPELETTSKKRPYSTLDSVTENTPVQFLQPGNPGSPIQDSFGYVTNQGQFRCALCLSQLPSQEDLEQHESLSKEHRRNLRNPLKRIKGREKLTQVTSVPPGPAQPPRLYGENMGLEIKTNGGTSHGPTQDHGGGSIHPGNHEESGKRRDTPTDTDTIEVLSYPATFPSLPEPTQAVTATRTIPAEKIDQSVDKGKGRAASLMSLSSEPSSQQDPQRDSGLSIEETRQGSLYTRPTTARKEIGSIAPSNTTDDHGLGSRGGPVPRFSTTEIADIMRSAELMKRFMSCLQEEAMANMHGLARSSENCSSSIPIPDTAPPPQVQSPKLAFLATEVGHATEASQTRREPERHPRQSRVKAERTIDIGEGLFILLD